MPPSQAKYQEIKQLARSQGRILSGAPRDAEAADPVWKAVLGPGAYPRRPGKDDEYIGPAMATDAKTVERLRQEIDLAKALAAGSAQLRLFGYQRIDRKPAAVLEVLFNRGLFAAGLALVGSHAYGALLNELGILAPGYRTRTSTSRGPSRSPSRFRADRPSSLS